MLKANLLVALVFTVFVELFLLNCDYWVDISPNFSIYNVNSANDCALGWGVAGSGRRRVIEDVSRYAVLLDGSVAIDTASGFCIVDTAGVLTRFSSFVAFENESLKRNAERMLRFRNASRFRDMGLNIAHGVVASFWLLVLTTIIAARILRRRAAHVI